MPTPHPTTPHRLADREFAGVLFDMDGTLIDSTSAVERSWRRWAEEYGVPVDRLTSFHGVPSAAIVAALLPADSHELANARIRDLEVGDTEGITVLPGAVEALEALASGGAHVAVVTSCTEDLAEARVRATGLPVPEVLVTASDVAQGKPAPDPYLRAAEMLGVEPDRCLVVEDAPSGLRAGRAAGCATLAVSSTSPAAELEPLADLVVTGLHEIKFLAADGRVRVRARTAPAAGGGGAGGGGGGGPGGTSSTNTRG